MTIRVRSTFTPSRAVFNPILSDEAIIDRDESASMLFYNETARRIERQLGLIVAVGAGASLLIAWLIGVSGGPRPLHHLFILLAFVAAGIPAIHSVWSTLRERRIDIDTLMLLGAGCAAVIGRPLEGALLLVLFALAAGLEGFAFRRTEASINALRDLAPTTATLVEGGHGRVVPLREVAVDDRVLVRPGEKVPLDGTVEEGASTIDESAITGEALPRDRSVGDEVFAGTQNKDGRLIVRVSRLAAESTLAKVVALVSDAKRHPARAQRLIDRIGPTYSQVVIVASILVAVVSATLFGLEAGEAIRRGIALLIVGSPCALIIATPTAYLSAIAAAARHGVLIKGGSHLEVIARSKAVIFDKTGTLTSGRIALSDVVAPQGLLEEEFLRLVGAVEHASNHPLATAVNEALVLRDIRPDELTAYTSTPGAGAIGEARGRTVWIGPPEHAAQHVPGVDLGDVLDQARQFRQQGKTASAVSIDGKLGFLAFQDVIREGAQSCIDELRRSGVTHVEMLTGDHHLVARQVSSQLGLDGYVAEMKPKDKLEAARDLRRKHEALIMVGDGINDAPALAEADVGIAMGGMGADVALDAADVVLMNNRIESVAWLYNHAKRAAAIVRQNLIFAIGAIIILSIFAVLGEVPLPLAVIGHEGSTVIVALNALRLLRAGAG